MKKYYKLILFLSVTFLFGYFIYINWESVKEVQKAISESQVRWLFAAILSELTVFYFVTTAHRVSLSTVGIKRKNKDLLPIVLGALVLNATTPTGGASGTVLFVNDAKKSGQSQTAAATGILLMIVTHYIGLLSILSFILIYLQSRGELGIAEIISTIILLFISSIYTFMIIVGKNRPDQVSKILSFFYDIIFKVRTMFYKKAVKNKNWVSLITKELQEASNSIHKKPRKLFEIIILHFYTHLFNIVTLYFIFLSFNIATKFGIIIVGYAIGELFKIVSPAPEGIGITEASMAVVYSSYGINPIDATAISLVYRGLNFWIPFFLGFIALQVKHLKISDFVS